MESGCEKIMGRPHPVLVELCIINARFKSLAGIDEANFDVQSK